MTKAVFDMLRHVLKMWGLNVVEQGERWSANDGSQLGSERRSEPMAEEAQGETGRLL